MTDPISALAQECYDRALEFKRPTRDIAAELVANASPALRDAMAVEFLVAAVAREQRAAGLRVERSATRSRSGQMSELSGAPKRGTRARQAWEKTPRGRQWLEEEEAARAREDALYHGALKRALDRYAEDLKVKWTDELLDTTFALRDGTTTTWGEATLEQHRQRKDIFMDNAHANMEGAARHEAAIRELESSGAPTLRELTGVAA